MTAAEVAGFIGVGLAGAAYLPQIWHLVREHCSAGISRFAFGVWLVASLLVTTHAIATRAGVFIVLGSVQILATTTILLCATKYARSPCAVHRRATPPGPARDQPGLVREPMGRHGLNVRVAGATFKEPLVVLGATSDHVRNLGHPREPGGEAEGAGVRAGR